MNEKMRKALAKATKFYRDEYGNTRVDMPSAEYHKMFEIPTQEEVCKLIEEKMDLKAKFIEPEDNVTCGEFYVFYNEWQVFKWQSHWVMAHHPELITFIGRFYEGRVKHE